MEIGKEEVEDVEEVVRAHALALSVVRRLGPRPVQFYRMAWPPSGPHNGLLADRCFPVCMRD